MDSSFSPFKDGWVMKNHFQFDHEFVPAAGTRQFVAGTPQILSLVALDSALEIFQDLDIVSLQEKALALSGYFLELVLKESDLDEFQLVSPTIPRKEGPNFHFRTHLPML